MNEVSIIINGVRYDAVSMGNEEDASCCNCDLRPLCDKYSLVDLCSMDSYDVVYKKSDKKFEK